MASYLCQKHYHGSLVHRRAYLVTPAAIMRFLTTLSFYKMEGRLTCRWQFVTTLTCIFPEVDR
jgi:hypothetical protein